MAISYQMENIPLFTGTGKDQLGAIAFVVLVVSVNVNLSPGI